MGWEWRAKVIKKKCIRWHRDRNKRRVCPSGGSLVVPRPRKLLMNEREAEKKYVRYRYLLFQFAGV